MAKSKPLPAPPGAPASDAAPERPSASKDATEARKETERIQRDSPQVIMRAALAKPFPASAIKWKPQTVKGNRCLATAYIDARLVMDRLDDVFGVGGWTDSYTVLPDGNVMCQLTVYVFGPAGAALAVTKTDVGNPSEQPDKGDRLKAAVSDALKRAAIKFGIGRYLYRLTHQWVDFDPVRKQIVRPPALPAWALPKVETPEERVEYHDPIEDGLASDATEQEPRPESNPEPKLPPKPTGAIPNSGKKSAKKAPEPEPEPEPEPLKDATLEKWKADVKDKITDCATAEDLTTMVLTELKTVPSQYKKDIWDMVCKIAASVEWHWKPKLNRFVDESSESPY